MIKEPNVQKIIERSPMLEAIYDFYHTHKLAITLAMFLVGVWFGFGLCIWGS